MSRHPPVSSYWWHSPERIRAWSAHAGCWSIPSPHRYDGRWVSPPLAADESQEVLVDYVGVGSEHAVRKAGVDLQRAVLEEFDRQQGSVLVGNDLVVVAVHYERGYVDALQILSEVGFREHLDAVVMRLRPAHHALAPPIRNDTFQRFCTRSVKAVEGTGRKVAIKLGTVGGQGVAKTVEHLDRQPAWIACRLHHDRRYCGHQHRFGDSAPAVPRDVARDLPPPVEWPI